jgi:hypothetical protein
MDPMKWRKGRGQSEEGGFGSVLAAVSSSDHGIEALVFAEVHLQYCTSQISR